MGHAQKIGGTTLKYEWNKWKEKWCYRTPGEKRGCGNAGQGTELDKVMVQHQERIRDEDKGQKGPMALIGYFPPYLYIYKELWTYLM